MSRPRPWWVAALLLALTVTAGCRSSRVAETTPTSTTTQASPPQTTTTSTVSEEPPDPLVMELEMLQDVTVRLTGLEFLEPVGLAILEQEEFDDRARSLFTDDSGGGGGAAETALLALLGIIEPGRDAADVYAELYEAAVPGFYDYGAGELVLRRTTAELSAANRATIVHELVHVLADQHFGLGRRLGLLRSAGRLDEVMALQMVAEGDAQRAQLDYFLRFLDPAEQEAMAAELVDADPDQLDEVPAFVAEMALLPYTAGLEFVTDLLREAGDALEGVYRYPPLSSEQVLHPDLYLRGERPLPVDLAPIGLAGYRPVEEGVFGEARLRALLVGTLGRGGAVRAAAGWGGDAYRVLWNGEDILFAFAFVGDTERDGVELEQALARWLTESAGAVAGDDERPGWLDGPAGTYSLERDGPVLTLIAATDMEAAAVGAAAVRGGPA